TPGNPHGPGAGHRQDLAAFERRQRRHLVLGQHGTPKPLDTDDLDTRCSSTRLLTGDERRSVRQRLAVEEEARTDPVPLLEPHGKRLLERGEEPPPPGEGGCGKDPDRRPAGAHLSPYSRARPSSQPGRVESGRTAIETAAGAR